MVFGRKVVFAARMELSYEIEERVNENAFRLKFGLVIFSAILIIGGSSILTTQPVGGGVLIFLGILLDLGVLRIYKLENEIVQNEIETTQTEVNQTKDEINTTKEQVDTAQTQISDSKDEMEDMKDSLYDKFGRYRGSNSLEGRANELEERIEDVEEQVEELQDATYSRSSGYRGSNSVEERSDELEERSDDLENTLENLKSELNDWEKELGGKGRRFRRL